MSEQVRRFYIMPSSVPVLLSCDPAYTPMTNHLTDVHTVPLVLATDYDALQAEAEVLRVALLEIASVNPAERGIEWAKSYASDGLKGAGSELYARWLETFKEAEALRAELAAIKGQQPVAFYWQDIGYPEPRKHGPYFGWPSESALRNVDGGAIPVPLYTLSPATLSPEVQASGPYASVAGALAQRYPKPSLLKDCNVSYSNSSRPLAEQGERQEAVASNALRQRFSEIEDEVARGKHSAMSCFTAMRTAALYIPQSGPDVRGLLEALEQIQRWDGFPPTGKFWEGSGAPMSYSACYGSNGERDFMRNVAEKALAPPLPLQMKEARKSRAFSFMLASCRQASCLAP